MLGQVQWQGQGRVQHQQQGQALTLLFPLMFWPKAAALASIPLCRPLHHPLLLSVARVQVLVRVQQLHMGLQELV